MASLIRTPDGPLALDLLSKLWLSALISLTKDWPKALRDCLLTLRPVEVIQLALPHHGPCSTQFAYLSASRTGLRDIGVSTKKLGSYSNSGKFSLTPMPESSGKT